jgi:hypothetical protein
MEPRNCFINKTTDNQLYDVLLSLSQKFYVPELISRDCFNGLTIDGQLWQIYSAISGGALWTPKQIPTVFWYDPSDAATITTSGASITQVTDKSGNGYTLSVITAGKIAPTIGTRTLNGLNVFEYALPDPNNQVLENNSFTYNQVSTPLNIAMIFRTDAEVVATQDFFFSGTEDAVNRLAVRKTQLNAVQMLGAGTAVVTPNGTAPDNQDFILVTKWNSTLSQLRLNGSLLSSGNIGTTNFSSINLGASEGEASSIEGYIAEVISFADSTQQERVEGYMAWKWGLVANLPVGHPYKNQPPLI